MVRCSNPDNSSSTASSPSPSSPCLTTDQISKYSSYCAQKGGQFSTTTDSRGCLLPKCAGASESSTAPTSTAPTTKTCLTSADMDRYSAYCQQKGGQFSSSADSNGCYQPKCAGINETDATKNPASEGQGVICRKTTASGCIKISCADGFSLNICTGSGAYGSS